MEAEHSRRGAATSREWTLEQEKSGKREEEEARWPFGRDGGCDASQGRAQEPGLSVSGAPSAAVFGENVHCCADPLLSIASANAPRRSVLCPSVGDTGQVNSCGLALKAPMFFEVRLGPPAGSDDTRLPFRWFLADLFCASRRGSCCTREMETGTNLSTNSVSEP